MGVGHDLTKPISSTNSMGPAHIRPQDLVDIGQWYFLLKIPDKQLVVIRIPFLESVTQLVFIMPLYKAWNVLQNKKKVYYCCYGCCIKISATRAKEKKDISVITAKCN